MRDAKSTIRGLRPSMAAGVLPALLMFLAVALFTAGCATTAQEMNTGNAASLAPAVAVELDGIKINSVRWSADGHLIDVRYEITDPDKASRVLTPELKPFLRHELSGKVLEVPRLAKVGRLQQTTNPPEVGRVYFMFFGNNGLISRGDPVTLILGDTTFEGLAVE